MRAANKNTMANENSHSKILNRAIGVCSVMTCALASYVIICWIFGEWRFVSLGSNFIPMAPCTALFFLILGISLFFSGRYPLNKISNWFALSSIFIVSFVSAHVFLKTVFEFDFSIEEYFFPSKIKLAEVPVGLMSPLSAFCFIMISIALLLELPILVNRRFSRKFSVTLSITGLAMGFVVLLSYGTDLPMLYDGRNIPMALLTAISFFILNTGVLLSASRNVWIMSFPDNEPATASDFSSRRFLRISTGTFIFLSLGIGAVGYFYLENQLMKYRNSAQDELSAIADLKLRQVSKWYSDHLDRAEYFLDSQWISESLKKVMDDPSDAESKNKIRISIDSIRKNFNYSRVLVFDKNLQVVLSAPEKKNWAGPNSMKLAAETLRTGKIVISDLHLSKTVPNTIDMDILVPLFPVDISSASAGKPYGILIMEINPHEFLFPLIQTWPTPSKSAETLLVRKDGNSVVYLNELRHLKNTALKLRFSIDDKVKRPSCMAVKGVEGVVEGEDYRGKPVLASLRKIPGTPWFIVAKMDKEEIYSNLKRQAIITLSFILLMILATALGIGFLWKQHNNQWLRAELRSFDELKKKEEELLLYRDHLEKLVKARTSELEAVNRELEAFSYSVSHDLKAPLRSVDGFAKILEEDYSGRLDEEGCRLLKVIRDSAKDMGNLINDLLEFSRMSRKEIKKTNIDMNELVRDVHSMLLGDLNGRAVCLEAVNLPKAYGDVSMMREVMVNLLSNAFKFTRNRKVAVVNVEGHIEGGETVFTVKDNGVGYDMAYKDKLFCVFQRLHSISEFEGTGIGLALVQRIVQRHGGRVWTEGRVGEGASFSFALPREG